ncbi:MAG: GDP-mannose 4,6-dehydratase, partial [Halobacteriaceae archaeon]
MVEESKIIITGGLGFIGSNLARSFAKTGAEIHIIDSELQEYGANRFNIQDIKSEIKIHSLDV